VEKRVLLEQLRGQLDAPPGEEAMFVALADARQRFSIPTDALLAVIDGGVQDTEQTRYADFDELRGYCVRVAGAVGRACVAIYGADEPERAETLGIALQLINIVAMSPRTGPSAASTCRRKSSSASASTRTTSPAGSSRPTGAS
jgi:phytoene synthase